MDTVELDQNRSVVVDASVLLAVLTNEPHKEAIVRLTTGVRVIAPGSIHWEIGNACSAMFKRRRITLDQALAAVDAYSRIPIHWSEVDLKTVLKLAHELNIYAYDAYVIECARTYACPLITLDKGLSDAARRANVDVLEAEL